MKAHIVGGGFGGLAAAAFLIRNAQVSGQDITIYEAHREPGGGLFLEGTAQSGYGVPGSVFDAEFRCTFELLADIPSTRNPSVSVKDEFFAFNAQNPFSDRARIVDRNGRIVPHGPRFGLSLQDGFDLVRLSLTPEAMLDGRRIDQFFSKPFFSTEFWLLWSTLMGSLPQHSLMELRRYINRALALFPDLYDMTHILRTPLNQHQAFIDPLVAWLSARGVKVETGAFVQDIGFAPAPGRITVNRLDIETKGAVTSIAVEPDDLVLVTTGSQVADLSTGSMSQAPGPPSNSGRSVALWKRLAQARADFGNPDVFFDPAKAPDSRWVTFTVTTTGTEFLDEMKKLTGSEAGRGGVVTLRDSPWVLSVTIFHQPEVLGQSEGTYIWWGYGLHPECKGDYVSKRMDDCSGAEILTEVVRQLKFDSQLGAIIASSTCIPCNMPYVNNIWMPRNRTDRPSVVPNGATNLELIGQYVEVQKDIAFTIEYSARTAWEAVYLLLKRGPPPPSVYQGQCDPKALLAALKVFFEQ